MPRGDHKDDGADMSHGKPKGPVKSPPEAQLRDDNIIEDREQKEGHEGARGFHSTLMNNIVSKLPIISLALTMSIALITSGQMALWGPHPETIGSLRVDIQTMFTISSNPPDNRQGDLRSDIQSISRASYCLPEGHKNLSEVLYPSKFWLTPQPRFEIEVMTMGGEGDSAVTNSGVQPKLEKAELNTIIMEPHYVRPLLCSSTQHFPDGNYPVLGPTSDRALITMILEIKMVEPAYDRILKFFAYVTLILSGVESLLVRPYYSHNIT